MSDQLIAQFVKRFRGGPAIEGRLTLPAAGFTCTVLLGPSGSGKTTNLRCLAGLERPESGIIRFGSETWCDAERGLFRSAQERQIGFVFQDYALFPHLTVAENIAYGLRNLPRAARDSRVAETLDRLSLRGLEGRFPRQISGGQQQRVALARSLVRKPKLLLLDEPLSALDPQLREQTRRELRKTLQAFDVPMVVVTHNRLEALALADRVVLLDEGRILQEGPTAAVFAQPTNATAARIVGVETVAAVQVLGPDGPWTRIRIAGVELLAKPPAISLDTACACIRAQDVVISVNSESEQSGTNRLRGRILAITDEGAVLRLDLDCGFRLAGALTRPIGAASLCTGDQVTVTIDPSAIQLVPGT